MRNIIVLAVMFFGSSAFAKDAGCGLGSMVIQQNTKLMQLFAVTTNGTFGSQTFGITFGTSNCSSSGFVMNEKQIDYFVEVNHDDLSREIAQGHGDKLNTLAALHGCADASAVNAFNSAAQSNFSQIMPSATTNAVDMSSNLKALSLGNACKG